MSQICRAAFAALMIGLVSAPAAAADLDQPGPVAIAPLTVTEFDPFQIRLRAIGVLPNSGRYVSNYSGIVSTKVTDMGVPELDLTYYFTKNWAAELILGATPHTVQLRNAIPALGLPAGYNVADSILLPPTLTLQYHFTNFGAFQPYVGAGVNYTFFLGTKQRGVFNAAHLTNTAGLALQVGFDYMIDRHWGVNVDFKKIFLDPGLRINSVALPAPAQGHIQLDPIIIGVGVTYRFGPDILFK